MNFIDKYNMTQEENIFLAKKELVSNIYNSAKLEGINTTYPDTKTLLDGANVPTMKLDEITTILNLRDAWKYILSDINKPLTLSYICSVNSYVSRNESLDWGNLRTGIVGISGVDYIPPVPNKNDIENNVEDILNEKNITKKALTLMLYLMRSQVFWDGNKRTSMLIANKILIENGKGIVTVKEKDINEFNKLLTEYYNTNDCSNILPFLYNNCIVGIDFISKQD